MARKSLINDYQPKNQTEDHKPTPAEAIKCKAQGCPLNGSMNMGGDGWLCTYHVKAGTKEAEKITEMLRENIRLINIEKTIARLRIDEYEALLERDSIELHELMRPVEGEAFEAWRHRVKQTIHKLFTQKTNEIIEEAIVSGGGGSMSISRAVKDLTSGILLPKRA